jgi:hypothetical protein
MDKTALLELLLAGFFAVGCIRARGPFDPEQKLRLAGLFQMTNRIERLRRSRWQWFSMMAVMLILRMQNQLPLALEIMVGTLFAIFVVFPVQEIVRARQ